MTKTKQERKEIGLAIQQFYQKPVAKLSLELFLSVGLTLFLIVAAIQPTLTTMTNLTKEINEKREINEKLPKKITALSSAQIEYLNVQDKLPLLDEAVPKNINLVRYLKIIEYEASQNSLAISSINLSGFSNDKKKDKKTEKRIMNITIAVDGSYTDIKNFAQRLENSRMSFLIHSISFTTKTINNKQHLISSITLSTPFLEK